MFNEEQRDCGLRALHQREDGTHVLLRVNEEKTYLLIIKEKGGELDGLTSGRKDRAFL